MDAAPSTLAGEIVKLRTAGGLTVDDLAARVGCRPGYLTAIEDGSEQPSNELLERLVEQLQPWGARYEVFKSLEILDFPPAVVRKAYVPSGRTPLGAGILILAVGGLAAGLVGAFGGLVLPCLDNLSRASGAWGDFGLWVEIVAKLLLAGVAGEVIAITIKGAGSMSKNRSPGFAAVAGVASGLIAFGLMLWIGGWNVQHQVWTIGPLMGVAMFSGVVVIPLTESSDPAEEPFCETDLIFMCDHQLTFPTSTERALRQALVFGAFERIATTPRATEPYNEAARVTLHYCPLCRNGYVDLIAKTGQDQRPRLLFSSGLSPVDVAAVLGST